MFQCKCTDDSETIVEHNQKLRTAYRSNQNLCTLKSCSTGNLDEIVTDTIVWVNKVKVEDFTLNHVSLSCPNFSIFMVISKLCP